MWLLRDVLGQECDKNVLKFGHNDDCTTLNR